MKSDGSLIMVTIIINPDIFCATEQGTESLPKLIDKGCAHMSYDGEVLVWHP